MAEKHGNLSINSENIFPIIKKWLYSDHDIFVRELVSNGCDAITKLKKLEVMGEYTFADDYKPAVQVVVDSDAKTLSIPLSWWPMKYTLIHFLSKKVRHRFTGPATVVQNMT